MPQKENCCLDLCSFFWASLLLGVLVPQVLAVWAASNSSFCVPDPMNGLQLCCLLLLAATVSLLGLLPYTKSQLIPQERSSMQKGGLNSVGFPFSPGPHCSHLVPQQQSDAFKKMVFVLIFYPYF